MKITLAPMTGDDRVPVMDIFNHYVENSFAAYPEHRLPYEFFDNFLAMCRGYPTAVARDESGMVAGFGMLRPYSPFPAFSGAAEISYFLTQGCTGHGIGRLMLDHLVSEARAKGLRTILANVSSLNEGSMRFHLKHGFVRCGTLQAIGCKNGREFDVVYFQLML